MSKPKIGLGSQIAKAMVFDANATPAKLRGVGMPLDTNTRWIRELIRDGEFEGYITIRTFRELVNLASEGGGRVQDTQEIVTNIINDHKIKVYSNPNQNPLIPFSSGEVGDYISLALDLDLDVFITKTSEMFERFLLENCDLRPKLKVFILTPRMFGKLKRSQHVNTNFKSGWGYSFRNIESLEELESLHQFETDILPQDTALTEDRLKDWWQSYRAGIKALFLEKQLMGVFSLWPLSKETVQSLREKVAEGIFEESSLNVLPYREGQKCKYWYIGGFYLHESLRGQGLSESLARKLLLRSLSFWLAGGESCFQPILDQGVELLAIPVNPFAKSILIKYGFYEEKGASHDGFPLYAKTIRTIGDLIL